MLKRWVEEEQVKETEPSRAEHKSPERRDAPASGSTAGGRGG